MPLTYFDPDAETADVVVALRRDGATVVTEQIAPEVVDAVLAELRAPFDDVGRFDQVPVADVVDLGDALRPAHGLAGTEDSSVVLRAGGGCLGHRARKNCRVW